MSHDDLIQRIQRRAWDPARRESTVYVPLGWLKRAYGEKVTGRIQHYRLRQPSNEGGSVTSLYWGPEPQDSLMEAALESGAPEALKYFSSVPHEPPYPPISHKDLRACEERIGQELPDLLRRVYTEVSNGGFGPAYSLLGLPPGGHRASETGPDALEEYEKYPELSRVLGFPLVAAGCSMYWYMSLTQPGNPVYLWDGDAWDFPDEQSPEVGIVAICSSLAEWFDRWVDGRSLETSYPDDNPWAILKNDPWLAATEWEHGV